jgi:glycosyltransferase involved in cell wall biosynthesis
VRIVVDLQGCQTASRERGIGRYAFSLARAMLAEGGRHDIILALNGQHPETVSSIRYQFRDLLPLANIRAWQSPEVPGWHKQDRPWAIRSAELIREQFLASLEPDAVFISSLFEGFDGDAVTSIGLLPAAAPAGVILYDLTPVRLPQTYLSSGPTRQWYHDKLRHLKKSSRSFAISEFSRQDGIELLGLHPERVCNISAAADPRFSPLALTGDESLAIRRENNAPHGYTFYYGGFDPHKNIERLIDAFAMLPASVRQANPLLLAGAVHPIYTESFAQRIARLELPASEVRFIGRVDDSELVRLIAASTAVVYPSMLEGFGLPVLEAMSVGAATICSSGGSLPEVIGRADAMFDPYDSGSIAGKLHQVLTDEGFRDELRGYGLKRAKLFSWQNSARKVLEGLESAHEEAISMAGRRRSFASAGPVRPKLAWLSDASVHSARITAVAHLSEYYDIDVYLENVSDADIVVAGSPVLPLAAIDDRRGLYDRVIVDCPRADRWCRHEPAVVVRRDGQPGIDGLTALPACLALLPAIPDAWSDEESELDGWANAAKAIIEEAYCAPSSPYVLAQSIVKVVPAGTPADYWSEVARAVVANRPLNTKQRLLVDFTGIGVAGRLDKGGIPHVVQRIFDNLLDVIPNEIDILPVQFSQNGEVLTTAHSVTELLPMRNKITPAVDCNIEPQTGDIFLGLNLHHSLARSANFARRMREVGGRLYAVVYDLLPMTHPGWFPAGLAASHKGWFRHVSTWDGLVCISQAVANEVLAELSHGLSPDRQPPVTWFHLGADFPCEAGSLAFPEFGGRPSILHVGQIWVRKGHEQTLAAFEKLWSRRIDANYVIAGRAEYGMERFIERLRNHPERGRRLHWFDSPDDTVLTSLYRAARGVVIPSEAEGFGLPLVEAVWFGRPLLCRDLPVFREIVGNGACYFSGLDASALSNSLMEWIAMLGNGVAPLADGTRILSWRDSAEALAKAIGIGDARRDAIREAA